MDYQTLPVGFGEHAASLVRRFGSEAEVGILETLEEGVNHLLAGVRHYREAVLDGDVLAGCRVLLKQGVDFLLCAAKDSRDIDAGPVGENPLHNLPAAVFREGIDFGEHIRLSRPPM